MSRYRGPVFTITLPILTDNNEKFRIQRSFNALSKVHNEIVAGAKDLLFVLFAMPEYQKLQEEYSGVIKRSATDGPDNSRLKAIGEKMNAVQKKLGLSKSGIEKIGARTGKRYNKLLSSQQVQKEADRVWSGVEKVLFGNGEDIHFKRRYDFDTISGKSNTNGVKFDKKTNSFEWMGHIYRCKFPGSAKKEFIRECFSKKVSFCEVKRLMFPTGWKYYLIVYLQGESPLKKKHAENGTMGIDIGTSTVAGYCSEKAFLEILAPDVTRYDEEINRLTQKMEMSRRISNPQKYNPDGTFVKNSRSIRWSFSKNYWKYRNRRKAIFRKRSEYIKHSHNRLANLMLRHANHFVVEKMNFQALAKRAKTTKKSSVPKLVTDKNGFSRMVCRYARKKRFGHSILIRAPAGFLSMLERKACRYGGELSYVNTTEFKASQYNHVTDTFTKAEIRQRSKQIGDTTVQRDLYSAFLLCNTDSSLEKADRERCSAGFAKFVRLQSALISRMKASGISRKSCFGF